MSQRSTFNIARFAGLAFLLFYCAYNTTAQELAVPTQYRLTVAETKWALDLTLLTYEITRANFNLVKNYRPKSSFVSPLETFAANGDALFSATDGFRMGTDHLHLMIRVQPAPSQITSSDFRDFVLKKIVKGASEKKYSTYNQVPIATYKTRNYVPWIYDEDGSGEPAIPRAKPFSQNLEAYLVKEDICATFTFMANSFDKEDRQLFYSLLDSVSFVDVTNPSTSFDYYQLGRVFQEHKDFKSAAQAFTSALKLERRQQELNRLRWRHLILDAVEVNKALSNWTEAAEALQYGLSKDSANTFFLMELARVYASQGDEAKTLAVLDKAFFHMRQQEGPLKTQESGVTVTWSLPDLSKDAAFKQLMKGERFREAVKAIKRQNSK